MKSNIYGNVTSHKYFHYLWKYLLMEIFTMERNIMEQYCSGNLKNSELLSLFLSQSESHMKYGEL